MDNCKPVNPVKLSQGYKDLVPALAIMIGRVAEDEILLDDREKNGMASAKAFEMTPEATNKVIKGQNKDTEADKACQAKEREKDKPKGTVEMPKKVYRPPLTSLYKEPDLGPDPLDNMD